MNTEQNGNAEKHETAYLLQIVHREITDKDISPLQALKELLTTAEEITLGFPNNPSITITQADLIAQLTGVPRDNPNSGEDTIRKLRDLKASITNGKPT